MPDYSHEGIEARLTDEVAGMGVSGLLSNQGTFHIKVFSPQAEGELFAFVSPDYRFELVIRYGSVEFRRNAAVARKTIGPCNHHFQILLSWGPEKFQLALMVDDEVGGDDACVTIRTDPMIFVPLHLLQWARQLNLLPRRSYDSVPDFLRTFIDALRRTGDKIRDTNSHSLFWDRQKAENSGARLVPKREPEAMAGLAAFLQDQSMIQGFELIRESAAGSGELDLFALAPLSAGGFVRLCVEGKNAHSRDIEHGLTDQLPAYMKHKQADHGIYLVLWYRCDPFPKPEESAIDLTWRLTWLRPLTNITIERFDVSIPRSPSDRRFEFR